MLIFISSITFKSAIVKRPDIICWYQVVIMLCLISVKTVEEIAVLWVGLMTALSDSSVSPLKPGRRCSWLYKSPTVSSNLGKQSLWRDAVQFGKTWDKEKLSGEPLKRSMCCTTLQRKDGIRQQSVQWAEAHENIQRLHQRFGKRKNK